MTGKKILIVDDDKKTVDLVRLYLTRDGHKVVTAYDGVAALNLALIPMTLLGGLLVDSPLLGIQGILILGSLLTDCISCPAPSYESRPKALKK